MNARPYISLNGYNKLTETIRALRAKADEIVAEIKENRSTETGDDAENAELMRLMAERESVSEEFVELERFLSSCEVVDVSKLQDETKVVRFGTKVTILDVDSDEEFTYTILGDRESNIKEGVISYLSPIGKALMNEKVGNYVSFETPRGDRELEILKVTRHG